MARTYRHLDQRRALFRLVEARMPVGEMAARLGHHPSTIYRELAGTASATGTEASAATSP